MAEYTGEVVASGGAKEYTGPVVAADPLSVPDSAPRGTPAPAGAKPAAEQPASLAQKVEGALEVPVSLATGALGSVAGGATAMANAFRPSNYGTQEGAGRAQETGAKVREWFQKLFTPTPKAQEYLEGIGGAVDKSKLAGIGPVGSMEMTALAPGVARAGGEAVKGAAEKVGMAGRSAGEFAKDVVGSRVKPAKAEAAGAARGAVSEAADALGESGSVDMQAGERAAKVAGRLETDVAARAAPANLPNLDVQGGQIRETFTKAMEGAKKARAERADTEFTAVREKAAAKEAAGGRVDTSAIEKELSDAITKADGIPDLEAGLKKMLSAVRGTASEDAVVNQGGWATVKNQHAAKGFDQLEFARRYLNDVGYSSDLEGFPAIVRSQARQTAKAIDKAMQEFVPEFGAYKDHYREMSVPLESLTTRFGKAVTGTEGGMQEGAYSKVANSALPTRLFSTREGVDVLVDALSGGKGSSGVARAEATKRVNDMVTNWILESMRDKDPAAALKSLSSPQMRSVLDSVPDVQAAVTKTFGELSGMQDTSKALTSLGKEMAGKGEKAIAAADKMKTAIGMADTLAAQPGKASKQKAFDTLTAALDAGRKSDAIPEAQYRAAVELIDRASTVEEKTAVARRIVGGVALAAAGFKGLSYFGL